MSPSARMFDGTAQAWAEGAETRGSQYGVERSYSRVGSVFRCAVQVRNRSLADRGPGESEVGSWVCYAPMSAQALAKGMVVQVLTGPEAGKLVRVVNPYKPRGRFQQTGCDEWDGELPEEEE